MPPIVLASRSPRRRELLSLLVGSDRVRVLPPSSAEEPGFENVHTWSAIAQQLQQIARGKCDDVLGQLTNEPFDAVIAADTVIVIGDDTNAEVLGQPSENNWEATATDWLHKLSGCTHRAATAVCIAFPDATGSEEIDVTHVTFRELTDDQIGWYIGTGEPRGKASGYAIQGLASLFVSRIEGSLTNVIGLPLEVVKKRLSTA